MSALGSNADGSQPGGSAGLVRLGRYELICEVAKAQFGALWVAATDGDPVLVRRIPRALPVDEALGERLSEAARWATRAQVNGFLSVVDLVASDAELGVVIEYTEGECLRALLRHAIFKRNALPPAVAVRIAVDVLEALDAARADEQAKAFALWPDSVLVGTDGQTLLLDLGIAGIVAAEVSWATHPELATYSAPERLDGGSAADGRSHVFSVGVLLWEMIANQRLFSGLSAATAKQKVQSAPIARLDSSKLGSPVGAPLAGIVHKALERDPAARYADVAALLSALRELGPEAIASGSEVGAALEQIGGPVLGLRRRAIDKVVGRAADASPAPPAAAAARRPRADATLLGVAPMALGSAPIGRSEAGRAPPRPPQAPRRADAGTTLLGVQSPALSPPPRRPLPPPPAKRTLPRTGSFDESGDLVLSGNAQSVDALENQAFDFAGSPPVAGQLPPIKEPPPFERDRSAEQALPFASEFDAAEPPTTPLGSPLDAAGQSALSTSVAEETGAFGSPLSPVAPPVAGFPAPPTGPEARLPIGSPISGLGSSNGDLAAPPAVSVTPVLSIGDSKLERKEPEWRQRWAPAIEKMRPVLDKLRPVTERLGALLKRAKPALERLRPALERLKSSLGPLLERLKPALERLRPVLDRLKPLHERLMKPELRRNRAIVLGVVGAMALLLTVAIVIGAVRSNGDEDQERAAGAQKPAQPAAQAAIDKPAEPPVPAKTEPNAAPPAESPAPREPVAAAPAPAAKPVAKSTQPTRSTAVASKKTSVKPGWGLPKSTTKQKLAASKSTSTKKTPTKTTATLKKTAQKKPATR